MPGMPSKSASWVHNTASKRRAVGQDDRIGHRQLQLDRKLAGTRTRLTSRSTTLPCCISAAAWSAEVSPRYCSTRLNTSYTESVGTIRFLRLGQRPGEEFRVGPVSQISQPAARNRPHSAQVSQSVSVPLDIGRNALEDPRADASGTSGISSTRSPYSSACIFCPGLRPNASRMRLGMTTWNFGDTDTVSITQSHDRSRNRSTTAARMSSAGALPRRT